VATGAVNTPALSGCPLGDLVDDDRITLMGLLVETHSKLVRILGSELEERCGMPLTWYDVLIRLGRSPEQRLTMTQLAHEISVTSGGATRLVDRVVEAGLVERSHCPSDRRSVHVQLTPAGRERLNEATAVHLVGLEEHLIEPLDAADRVALERALRKLRGAGTVCGA
jgi:DNA-binding MarR family transcriptional regulator